uniref:Uncharacterized protein n=1 Tax=Setaria digitata TaxID=48799 RepID=A0A915PPW3_9BILA
MSTSKQADSRSTGLVAVTTAHKASIKIDENAQVVIFGMRHGNRHPSRFLDNGQRTWGFEGDCELTQFGKREGFGFGKELREFVGPLVGNNYMRHEVAFYTSSANRCQMTLQVVMAGLYPPDAFAEWNHALEWSPVPYTIDDPMLQIHLVPNCSTVQRGLYEARKCFVIKLLHLEIVWEPIIHDTLPELASISAANAPLFDYIAKHTGWNKSIKSASDLADNILEMILYNTSLPDWVERPTMEGFNKQSLKDAIMAFIEKHSLVCVNYEPCRDTLAGFWLNHVLTILRNTTTGQESQKLIGYVSASFLVE